MTCVWHAYCDYLFFFSSCFSKANDEYVNENYQRAVEVRDLCVATSRIMLLRLLTSTCKQNASHDDEEQKNLDLCPQRIYFLVPHAQSDL